MSRLRNATKTKPVDQKDRLALFERLDRLRDHLRVSGTVVSTFRTYKSRRLGPYFRLAYRVDGRQCAVFIGGDADVAEEVRQYLSDLQRPRDQKFAVSRARRAAAQQMVADLAQFDVELAAVGLRRRGSQVIGWRAWERHRMRKSPIEADLEVSNGVRNGDQTT